MKIHIKQKFNTSEEKNKYLLSIYNATKENLKKTVSYNILSSRERDIELSED